MDVLEALKEKANSVTWNKEFRKEYFCMPRGTLLYDGTTYIQESNRAAHLKRKS